MGNDVEAEKPKKSQKRRDRQERKAERRRQREAVREGTVSKKQQFKPVRARLSKKSLPGFLAKNTDAIRQWLKDYQTLFVMADDYGFQNLDRLPEPRRQQLVQNYVDVGNFLLMLDAIILELETPASCQPEQDTADNPPEDIDGLDNFSTVN